MDISKLRKKRKEEKERKEAPKGSAPGPEEPAEKEEREPEKKSSEEPTEGPRVESEPPEGEVQPVEEGEAQDAPKGSKDEAAPPVSTPEETGEQIAELLIFSISEELYAFRITDVQEVLRPQRITRVPRTAEFIAGVTSMRGKMIPVVDLKKRLHTVEGGPKESSNIVILQGTGRGLIGLLVDRTIDVLRIPEGEIMQPPSHLEDSEARFLEGVVSQNDKFISIIQPKELLDFNAADGVS